MLDLSAETPSSSGIQIWVGPFSPGWSVVAKESLHLHPRAVKSPQERQ